jgi:hypothetical protein
VVEANFTESSRRRIGGEVADHTISAPVRPRHDHRGVPPEIVANASFERLIPRKRLRLPRKTGHVFYATFALVLNCRSYSMGEQYPMFE